MAATDARSMVDIPSLRAIGTVEEAKNKLVWPLLKLYHRNSPIVRGSIIPVRRAEQGSRLCPRRFLEGVAAFIREKAELVASRAAVAGREGEERLAVVIQWCWTLVDAETVNLPGLQRQREFMAGANAPGGVECGYAETLQVAGDARPDEVVLVI